jgi:hypothetical protein
VSADQPVTNARDYLDGARRRKVAELPPSLLMRECAELRRLLGQVLGLLDSAVTLDQDQAATALDALDFAAEYRRYRASLTCAACAAHPAELCADHAADLDRAEEYDALAVQIGGAR